MHATYMRNYLKLLAIDDNNRIRNPFVARSDFLVQSPREYVPEAEHGRVSVSLSFALSDFQHGFCNFLDEQRMCAICPLDNVASNICREHFVALVAWLAPPTFSVGAAVRSVQ